MTNKLQNLEETNGLFNNPLPLPFFIKMSDSLISFVIYYLPKSKAFIGFPKYFPAKERTNICIDGIFYKRGKKYSAWFNENIPIIKKYLRYVDQFGEKLFVFEKKDVIKIFHPLTYYENVKKEIHGNKHLENVFALVDSLEKFLGIKEQYIGIEGSTLFSVFNDNSDIDAFIYGQGNQLKVLNNFSKLASNKNIKLYTKKDYFSIIEKRSNIGFGLAKESIFLQEMRRFGGFINGTKFNLINVADVSKETVFDDTRKIRYIGIFSGKLTIIDDSLGIAIPGIVWADDERGSRYRIELITPYGINQAKTGEKFYVHGDLYKNIHTQERIIILSFWGHGEIRFNLLLKNDYEKTRQ